MTMKAFTPAQAREEIKRQKLKCVWLENQRGDQVVSKNPPNTDVDSHLDRIFRTLDSQVMPDGIYFVKGKESTRSKSTPLQIPVAKGAGMAEGQAYLVNGQPFNPQQGDPVYQPGAMSWQQVLQMYADNARLQAENSVMRQSLATAEARADMLQEIVDDLREENRDLADGQAQAGQQLDMNGLALAAMPGLMEMLKPTPKQQPGQPGAGDPQLAQLVQAVQALAQQQQQQQQQLQALVDDLYEEDPGQDPPAQQQQIPAEMSEDEMLAALQQQDPSGELVKQYLTAKQQYDG